MFIQSNSCIASANLVTLGRNAILSIYGIQLCLLACAGIIAIVIVTSVRKKKRKRAQELAKIWTCDCGATAKGKFCPECGAKKPEEEKSWICSCGQENSGKFCDECGAKKPESNLLSQ